MSTQRYSVTPHPIETLLTWVKSGEIAIPEIQRPFVWEATKVRNLLDSLYQGYPVGYLIAWRNPTVKLKDGTPSAGKRILIDGQQRVTALMAALLGREVLTKDYETVRIRIAFHPGRSDSRSRNPAIAKDVAWIHDVAEVFAPDARPDRADRAIHRDATRTPNRKTVGKVLQKLGKIINNHVGIIELAEDLDIETVTEIFIRVNSAGAELSQADFAMSKIAVNETYGGNLLRKAIDYFCHLAVAPEFSRTHREGRHGLRRVRVPAEDALAQGRQRRPLRPDLHRHAARGLHLRVRPRQAAGPGRAALGPQLRDQAIRGGHRRGVLRQAEARHHRLHEQDPLRPSDHDPALGWLPHQRPDRQPERRQLRLHPLPARAGRRACPPTTSSAWCAAGMPCRSCRTLFRQPGDGLRLRHPPDRGPGAARPTPTR